MLGNSENILSVHFLMKSDNSVGLSTHLHFVDSICRFMEIGSGNVWSCIGSSAPGRRARWESKLSSMELKGPSGQLRVLNPVCALDSSSGILNAQSLTKPISLPTPPEILIHWSVVGPRHWYFFNKD